MQIVKATIDRFEDGKAVIIFADGEQIIISREKIGNGFQEGDALRLTFSASSQDKAGKQKIVRSILKDIIKKDGEA